MSGNGDNSSLAAGIEAAQAIYREAKQWQAADRALATLAKNLPKHEPDAVLIKLAALNNLYGANVMRRKSTVAEHISSRLRDHSKLHSPPVDLVGGLAKIGDGEPTYISAASKYAHFFIDSSCYPVFDTYAVNAVKAGDSEGAVAGCDPFPTQGVGRYRAFYCRFERIRTRVPDMCISQIDRYLWLKGLLMEKTVNNMNSEIRDLLSWDCLNGKFKDIHPNASKLICEARRAVASS